ncbi:MAG: tripartite tricarboxylate transporter substrate-binding protein [Pseudomonadota bacterium]
MKLYAVLAGILVLIVSMVAAQASEEVWRPSKPVEIWVTFGKGAHADIWAKQIISIIEKDQLSSVPFKVVNIPKGAGVEAFPRFGNLENEEHKLMLALPNIYTVPLFKPNVKFNLRLMTPIALMGSEAQAIWIKSQKLQVNSVKQLANAARQKGRMFKMVGPPEGTPRAMLSQMFMALHAINGTYVGIKSIGSTARKLAEDDFDAAVYNPSEQFKLTDPGRVKPIAFFADQRARSFQSIPTLPELGLPLTYHACRTIIGPKDMSPGARQYYKELFRRVYESPEWQKIRKEKEHLDRFLVDQELQEFIEARIAKHERWKMAVEVLLQTN